MLRSDACFPSTLAMTLAVTLLVGCAPKRAPIYLDPAMSSRAVKKVGLVPIVDRRLDRSVELDVQGQVYDRSATALADKGFEVVRLTSYSADEAMDPSDLAEMRNDELTRLSRDELDAVMVVFVEDVVSSYDVITAKYKVELSAVLVSRTGVLWRDKMVGTGSSGGLLDAALGGLTGLNEYNAYESGVGSLFSSLPSPS